jgi:peroxiredoxin Q/BCP
VLYFYPVDQTRGCTAQACDFRDSIDRFLGSNYQVLGVSPQDAASHQEFAAAHDLNFPLLVDEGGEVAQRYGVWQDIGRDGRSVMGNKRSTFVIDEDGALEYVEYGVQWDGSVQRLMDTLGV